MRRTTADHTLVPWTRKDLNLVLYSLTLSMITFWTLWTKESHIRCKFQSFIPLYNILDFFAVFFINSLLTTDETGLFIIEIKHFLCLLFFFHHWCIMFDCFSNPSRSTKSIHHIVVISYHISLLLASNYKTRRWLLLLHHLKCSLLS